jgi:hypothetical protein
MLLSILFFTGVGVVGHGKPPVGASDGIQLNLVAGTDRIGQQKTPNKIKQKKNFI